MTKKRFIKVLEKLGYPYKKIGRNIVITNGSNINTVADYQKDVYLNSVEQIPIGVIFQNDGDVVMRNLISVPLGVEFKNKGKVYLDRLIKRGYGSKDVEIKDISFSSIVKAMSKRGIFR